MILITPSMYITPFSPRAADFCIISSILPPLGGREDPPFTDGRKRRGRKAKGGKEGAAPRLTHLVTGVRYSLAGDLGRKWKNTTAASHPSTPPPPHPTPTPPLSTLGLYSADRESELGEVWPCPPSLEQPAPQRVPGATPGKRRQSVL